MLYVTGSLPIRVRAEVVAMPRYRQGKSAGPDEFKLSSNENPYPPLPSVIAAIESELEINRYPDGSASELTAKLADFTGLSPDHIAVGPGSITILQQLLAAVAGPGDEVIYPWRSFEGYPTVVTLSGATAIAVPLLDTFEHDLEAMAHAVTERTKAIFLCTPNNPTGNVLTTEQVEWFLALVPSDILVVIDEAYIDFVRDPAAVDGLTLLEDHPNLVSARTFSKAHGLAGLRVGYALGNPEIIDVVKAAGLPMSVPNLAQRAAVASLDAIDDVRERVDHLVSVRNRVIAGLVDQGWQVPPTHANFVWLPLGAASEAAGEIFARHGIVARVFADSGVRVGIGEDESVEPLLNAASEVVTSLTVDLG